MQFIILQYLFYDVNGAPKTGMNGLINWLMNLKNGLITLWKIIPSDARNSQQLFPVEKTQHGPLSGENK